MKSSIDSILACCIIILLFLYITPKVNSSQPIKVDPKIHDGLKLNKDVHVVILLRTDLFQTDAGQIRDRKKIRLQKQIISSLNRDEFVLESESSFGDWFSGIITKNGLNRLKDNPNILRIYSPVIMYPALSSSVPHINATAVWNEQIEGVNLTGRGETICVVDTGVDSSHPDLSGKVVAEYCYCNITDYGNGGCCPNNNYTDMNATDDEGHGTHIAGIIAANGNLKGVAPDSKLAAVKIANSTGAAYESNIAKGIEWCVLNAPSYNISVISLSYITNASEYGYNNSEECDPFASSIEVNKANESNITVVVASGNEGNTTAISVPACASGAISVGASGKTDYFAGETNVAEILDLLAPGVSINSTGLSGGYVNKTGTSMATPHVAGAATLLIQYEKLKNNYNITPSEVENRFKETGIFIEEQQTDSYFPRIDAYAALFPIDTYKFTLLNSSSSTHIFGFKIMNNFNNKTKNVSWALDFDDGTAPITNSQNISLSPKSDVFVFISHSYNEHDVYNLNATSSSAEIWDSETMTVRFGDLITHNLRQLQNSSLNIIVGFNILNNLLSTITNINWSLDKESGIISVNSRVNLTSGNESFVFVNYSYGFPGSYTVNATATNATLKDTSRNITVVAS